MISRSITQLFFICLVFFSVPMIGNTQLVGITENDVSIGISPENPEPNSTASVTIETYSFNLDNSNTRWYVNNTLAQEGKGLKTLTFDTGQLGKPTVIKIIIDSDKGQIIKTTTITPSVVNILWEAQTYTPPFFKGKALFSHQSTVVFFAQPELMSNGKQLNPANLIYTWSKDGTVLGSLSGYGKQSLILTGSVISRPLRIFVEVTDPITNISGSGVITITPVEPEVLTYVVSPLYGVQYEKAIKNNLPLIGKEVTLQAEPYYFSALDKNTLNNLAYNWSINGTLLSDNLNTRTRVFRKVGDIFGVSNIGLKIGNDYKLLQFASYQLAIDFLKDRTD